MRSSFRGVGVHIPDILPVLRALHPLGGSNRLRMRRHVGGPAVPHQELVRQRALLLPAAQLPQVLKVALGHLGLVLAAEDADLEILDLARALGGLDAGVLEVLEVLEDDLVRVDMFRDLRPAPAIRDELCDGC